MSPNYPPDFYHAQHSYVRQGHRDLLPSILQSWVSNQANSADPDHEALSEVLHRAVSRGHTADVLAILDAGAPPTLRSPYEGYDTPLFVAAEFGQREVARLLWERVGPSGRFYSSLQHADDNPSLSCIGAAAAGGHTALVADFLDIWDGWTPGEMRYALMSAAGDWHPDTVDLLLQTRAA